MIKSAIRKQTKQLLKKIPQHEISEQSAHILETLISSSTYKQSKSIAIFMNMPTSEPLTEPIISQFFKDDKLVYLPQCVPLPPGNKRFPNQTMKMKFRLVETFDQVSSLSPKGPYSLREPETGIDLLENGHKLDLMIVPGVGFTRDFERIGHGAGFYDDFISRYEEKYNSTPYLLGIGLQQQLLPEGSLPIEPHDRLLDGLIINNLFISKS